MNHNQSKKLNIAEDVIHYFIHHAPCKDGEGSAFALWRYILNNFGPDMANKIEFVKYNYDNTDNAFNNLLPKIQGKNIIISDCTFPNNQMHQLIDASNKIKIYDHHQSALVNLEGISSDLFVLDQNIPAFLLVWRDLYPNQEIPKLVNLVTREDNGDPYKKTWEEMIDDESYLFGMIFKPMQNLSFDAWSEYLNDNKIDSIINDAKNQMSQINEKINKLSLDTVTVNQMIGDVEYKISYLENDDFRLINCLGHKFCSMGSDIFSSYKSENGKYVHSLRSLNGGNVNVASVAKIVDPSGGGHFNAARCITGSKTL